MANGKLKMENCYKNKDNTHLITWSPDYLITSYPIEDEKFKIENCNNTHLITWSLDHLVTSFTHLVTSLLRNVTNMMKNRQLLKFTCFIIYVGLDRVGEKIHA